jgi:hypothetical protein
LDEKEYKAYIITLCREEENSRWNEFKKINVDIVSLNLPRGYKFLFYIKSVKKVIRKISPDIIHCIGFRADVIAWLYLKKYKKLTI